MPHADREQRRAYLRDYYARNKAAKQAYARGHRNDWVWALTFKVHRFNVDEFVQRVTAHETGCRPFREPA